MSRRVVFAGVMAVVQLVAAGGLVAVAGGEDTTARAPAARAVATPGPNDWKQVSAGVAHTCGVRVSGRLYCWGSDASG